MKKFRLAILVVITALTAYLIFSHLSCKEKVEREVAGENFVTVPYDVTDYLDSAPDFQIQNIATTGEIDFSGLSPTVENPIDIKFGMYGEPLVNDCKTVNFSLDVNEPNVIVCDKALSEFINRMYLIMTNADSNNVKIIFTDGVLTGDGFEIKPSLKAYQDDVTSAPNTELAEMEYAETNGVPVCPYCRKPTKRSGVASDITCVYYKPVYDEQGNNTNPDHNTITSCWYCYECGRSYETYGNYTDGFNYSLGDGLLPLLSQEEVATDWGPVVSWDTVMNADGWFGPSDSDEPNNVIIIDLTDPNLVVTLSIIKENGEWEIIAKGNWKAIWRE